MPTFVAIPGTYSKNWILQDLFYLYEAPPWKYTSQWF